GTALAAVVDIRRGVLATTLAAVWEGAVGRTEVPVRLWSTGLSTHATLAYRALATRVAAPAALRRTRLHAGAAALLATDDLAAETGATAALAGAAADADSIAGTTVVDVIGGVGAALATPCRPIRAGWRWGRGDRRRWPWRRRDRGRGWVGFPLLFL